MADFKIKPAAGTGNKLILESEDGTDVLTTSDSGVAITAPTIADLSNVTGTLPVGVTGGSGLTALGTVTAGVLSAGVALKIYTINQSTDTGDQDASSGYNFGTEISIPSSENPNGAKYLVITGGGRLYVSSGYANCIGVSLEGGTTWTTTNGTEVSQIVAPYHESSNWADCSAVFGLYTNSSGGAVGVEFKCRVKASSSAYIRLYASESVGSEGLIAIRVH
jgi:hypothetical protein